MSHNIFLDESGFHLLGHWRRDKGTVCDGYVAFDFERALSHNSERNITVAHVRQVTIALAAVALPVIMYRNSHNVSASHISMSILK